jgi:hypothetical protein
VRRALPAVLAVLAALLLASCGGGGDRTAAVGNATVTIPSDVHGLKGELRALLEQFPYQRWYTACVEQRFEAGGEPEAGGSLNAILAKAGAACERTSHGRKPVDPNASSQELDLLRAELVPTMVGLAESNGLDPSQSECLTGAFEKLPDKYIVQFGNGDEKLRGDILLTVFKTCAEAG